MITVAASLLQQLQNVSAQSTLRSLKALIAEPTSNLALAMIVLSAVALLILLLIVGLLLLFTPKRRRVVRVRRYSVDPALLRARQQGSFASLLEGALHLPAPGVQEPEPEEPAEPEPAEQPEEEQAPPAGPVKPRLSNRVAIALGSPIVVALLVAVALVGTYVTTSLDGFCAGACHGDSEIVHTAARIDHARCVQCHEESGLAGVVPNTASRLRMVTAAAMGADSSGLGVSVPSRTCLECHEEVHDKTLTTARGVKVSHKEFLDAGSPCSDCHPSVGHSRRVYTGDMSACITCHDGKTVSAECDVCHVKDPVQAGFKGGKDSTQTVGSGNIIYAPVNAANRRCEGCHDVVNKCDPCHGGVRMPHSDAYKAGGHAPDAVFEGKAKCWRCHNVGSCNGLCHTSMSKDVVNGHPDSWRVEHRAAPWRAPCGCHANRSRRTTPMCPLCHGNRGQ